MAALKSAISPATTSWDAAQAGHLARRAGFGLAPVEVRELVELGRAAAVDRLVDYPALDGELEREIIRAGGELTDNQTSEQEKVSVTIERLRRKWIFRMAYGRQPLQEKLALFWHDHFACQQSKVIRLALVRAQLESFRTLGNGSFRELLGAVARDPGMLVFLDNRVNQKASPNENWAREILELFALGIDRYSQHDIDELARVFTGWTTPAAYVPEFTFDHEQHDVGDKQVLGHIIKGLAGEAGMQEGDEVMDVILAHEASADFIAAKLMKWFGSHEPEPAVVAQFGRLLRDVGFSIREWLRAFFMSEWFNAPEQRACLYKNPIEFIVSSVRLLGVQNAHLFDLELRAHEMGMRLFEPPSVAGWDHGSAWINSASVVSRFNFALAVSELPHTEREVSGTPALNLTALCRDGGVGASDEQLLDSLSDRLLPRPLDAHKRGKVLALLGASQDWLADESDPEQRFMRKTRWLVHVLLTAPEFAFA